MLNKKNAFTSMIITVCAFIFFLVGVIVVAVDDDSINITPEKPTVVSVFVVDDNGMLTEFNPKISGGEIVIPENVDGKQITKIGPNVFKNQSEITKITINNSITQIGESAFEGCKKLESIEFSPKVETIKENAFKGCEKLCRIKFNSKSIVVMKNAFLSVSASGSIQLLSNLTNAQKEGFKTALSNKGFAGAWELVNFANLFNGQFFSYFYITVENEEYGTVRLLINNHEFPIQKGTILFDLTDKITIFASTDKTNYYVKIFVNGKIYSGGNMSLSQTNVKEINSVNNNDKIVIKFEKFGDQGGVPFN
ncbi:MAG: leucine-rich repeat domain-containing protein [Clostridia bacterium]